LAAAATAITPPYGPRLTYRTYLRQLRAAAAAGAATP
jgi:hypothetical protein